jgi:hypothetical protein
VTVLFLVPGTQHARSFVRPSMKSIGTVCTTFFSTLALACSFAAEPVAARGLNEQEGIAATSVQAEQKQACSTTCCTKCRRMAP